MQEWTTPVGVALVAYETGIPGEMVDPKLEWTEITESAIKTFNVPRSTVVVLHPGSQDAFEQWVDWSLPRRGDVALLVMSYDYGSYQKYLDHARSKRRVEGNLDHIFVMPEALQKQGREHPRHVAQFMKRLSRFVKFVHELKTPLTAQDAPKIWAHHFSGVRIERRSESFRLYTEAMALVLVGEVSHERAKKVALERGRLFTNQRAATDDFLAEDEEVGVGFYPYSLFRQALHHTTLTQRLGNKLRASSASESDKNGAITDIWIGEAAAACSLVADWAQVALNPSATVRAAMFLNDPWATPSADDVLDPDDVPPDAAAAATKIIEAAKADVPAEVAARVTTFRAAIKAADDAATAGNVEAFVAALATVSELLGNNMKVRHGSEAVG